MLTKEQIAKIVHEINRNYCISLGDESQKKWDDISEKQKYSVLQGVELLYDKLDVTAKDLHDSWVSNKVADGWIYGKEKSEDKKTHPCLVPYHDLIHDQKVKDIIFRAVVLSLIEL